MRLANEFQRYLRNVTGELPGMGPLPEADASGLPLFLHGLYDFEAAKLFGRCWILAMQKPTAAVDAPVPSELVRHVKQMSGALGAPVALVLTRLTPYLRQQLLCHAIPFVAPGRQVFLPMAWIDLRERYPRRGEDGREFLSAPAQLVMLHHLLKRPVEGQSLRVLAGRLGYSPMTFSKVADELARAGWCEVLELGRSRTLRFPRASRSLWKKVRQHLRTPVRSRHWATWARPPETAREAGLTALAHATMIGDDALPTYALRERDYRRLLESGQIRGCPGPDAAKAQVECWAYDPALLGNREAVDPLSLVLSLADHGDERVQQAIGKVEVGLW